MTQRFQNTGKPHKTDGLSTAAGRTRSLAPGLSYTIMPVPASTFLTRAKTGRWSTLSAREKQPRCSGLVKKAFNFLLIYIAAFLIQAAALPTPPLYAEDAVHQEMERSLASLINQARANPLDMAAAVGLDPDKVLADLPGMAAVLTHGLPPLMVDERITVAARTHTADMLANDFIGHLSSDGRNVNERLAAQGFEAVAAGEDLGLVGFINFIDPQSAVLQVFSNLYKAELNPARTRPHIILTTATSDIGIGFGSGTLTLSGQVYNAYLATVDIGLTIWDLADKAAAQINQVRATPRAGLYAVGIDPAPYIFANPALGAFLDIPQPPLVTDDVLEVVAAAHSADMLVNNFVSHVGSDGREYNQRLLDSGYLAAAAQEGIAMTGFVGSIANANAMVIEMVARLLRYDLDQYLVPGNTPVLTVLDGTLQAMGVGLAIGPFKFDAGTADILLGTVALAAPAVPPVQDPFHIIVAVWDDRNNDGAYSCGEEFPGAVVRLSRYTPFGYVEEMALAANAGGEAVLPVTRGFYQVLVEPAGKPAGEYFLRVEGTVRISHNVGATS